MNALIIFAHPDPSSFNAALKEQARKTLEAAGHQVTVSDLYAEDFDPREGAAQYGDVGGAELQAPLALQREASQCGTLPADVRREIDRLWAADLLILQFPLWWHGMPAILKGWMDRVFVAGELYASKRRYDTGAFRGKRAFLSVTTGAPAEAFGPGARGGDLDAMLFQPNYSLHYMGFEVLTPIVSFGVQGHGFRYNSDDAIDRQRASDLSAVSRRLESLGSASRIRFPGWADWDDRGAPLSPNDAPRSSLSA